MNDSTIKFIVKALGADEAVRELNKIRLAAKQSGTSVKEYLSTSEGAQKLLKVQTKAAVAASEQQATTNEQLAGTADKVANATNRASDAQKGYFMHIAKTTIQSALVNKIFLLMVDSMGKAVEQLDLMHNFPASMQALGLSATDATVSFEKLRLYISGIGGDLTEATTSVARFAEVTKNVKAATAEFIGVKNALIAGGAGATVQANALEQMIQAYSRGMPQMIEWKSLMVAMPAQLNQVADAMGFVNAQALGESLTNSETSMQDFITELTKMSTGTGPIAQQAIVRMQGIQFASNIMTNTLTNNLTAIYAAVGRQNIVDFLNFLTQTITVFAQGIIYTINLIVSLINAITRLFGGKTINKITGDTAEDLGTAAGSAADIGDSLGTAADEAKKLSKQLAPFDKMNVLADKTSGSKDSNAGNAGVGLNVADASALESIFENITGSVRKSSIWAKIFAGVIAALVAVPLVKKLVTPFANLFSVIGGLMSKIGIFNKTKSVAPLTAIGNDTAGMMKAISMTNVLKGAAAAALVGFAILEIAGALVLVSKYDLKLGNILILLGAIVVAGLIMKLLSNIATDAIIGSIAAAVVGVALAVASAGILAASEVGRNISLVSLGVFMIALTIITAIFALISSIATNAAIAAIAGAVIGVALLVTSVALALAIPYIQKVSDNAGALIAFAAIFAIVSVILALISVLAIPAAIATIAGVVIGAGILVTAIALSESVKYIKNVVKNVNNIKKFVDALEYIDIVLAQIATMSVIATIAAVSGVIIGAGILVTAVALTAAVPFIKKVTSNKNTIIKFISTLAEVSIVLGLIAGLAIYGAISSIAVMIISGGLLVSALALSAAIEPMKNVSSNIDVVTGFSKTIAIISIILGIIAGLAIFGAIAAIAVDIISGGLLLAALALSAAITNMKYVNDNSQVVEDFGNVITKISEVMTDILAYSIFGAVATIAVDIITGGLLLAAIALSAAVENMKYVVDGKQTVTDFVDVLSSISEAMGSIMDMSIFGMISSIATAIISGGLLLSAKLLSLAVSEMKAVNAEYQTVVRFAELLKEVTDVMAEISLWNSLVGVISIIASDVITGGLWAAAKALSSASAEAKKIDQDSLVRLLAIINVVTNIFNRISVWGSISSAISSLVSSMLAGNLSSIATGLKDAADKSLLINVAGFTNLQNIIDRVKNIDFGGFWANVGNNFSSDALKTTVTNLTSIATQLNSIPMIEQGVLDNLERIKGAVEKAGNIKMNVIALSPTDFQTMLNQGVSLAQKFIDGVNSLMGMAGSAGAALQGALWNAIEAKMQDEYYQGATLAGKIVAGIKAKQGELRSTGMYIQGELWAGLESKMQDEYYQGATLAKKIVEGIRSVISSMKDVGAALNNAFLSGVSGDLSAATARARTLANTIINTIWSTQSSWWSIGDSIAGSIAGGISRNAWQISNAVKNAIGNYKIDFTANTSSNAAYMNVTRLARGGVISGPTPALIGEDGTEAVVPLENNTEWIDKLAAKIKTTSSNGQPMQLTIKIGEETIATKVIDLINEKTQMSGRNAILV